MTPYVAQRTLTLFKSMAPRPGTEEELSQRELEVLTLLVEGMSTEQISERLFISYQTVRNHFKHIYRKLHVHSQSQAVSKALRSRLV